MKFEEKNAKKYKKHENNEGYIYFLIKNEEVVYVGQTITGVSRPLSHKDKDFDYFYMKKCPKHLLDKRENEMIFKYNPKYNNSFNICDKWVGRCKLREETLEKTGVEVRTVFIDHILDKLGIKQYISRANKAIALKDKDLFMRYVKNNVNEIVGEQNKSLSESFYDDKEKEKMFCWFLGEDLEKNGYYKCAGLKIIKDLLYFGFIDKEFIEMKKKQFEEVGYLGCLPNTNGFKEAENCYPKKYQITQEEIDYIKKNGLRNATENP